jgi:hypothetical protein
MRAPAMAMMARTMVARAVVARAILIVGLVLSCGLASGQTAQQPAGARVYSADGLYNLGNSYARAGKPGLAVLSYERALLLAPEDADINANLEYVRAAAHVPTETRGRVARVVQGVSPMWAAWVGVAGIAIIGGALVVGKRARRFRALRVSGILLGILLIGLTVSNAVLSWPRLHEGVVLVVQAPVRVTPVPMGDTAFVLREAETVTVTAQHEEFMLVRTRGGRSGWVARASVGAVVP